MVDHSPFTVRRVEWDDAIGALRSVRKTVFVDEQSVPEELEWDGIDDECIHVLAETSARHPIGTGRLLPSGYIGRMAVLKPWRCRGVGSALLTALLAAAKELHFASVQLSAQTHAIGFYRRHGFETVSEEYLDAGIPHRAMRRATAISSPGSAQSPT